MSRSITQSAGSAAKRLREDAETCGIRWSKRPDMDMSSIGIEKVAGATIALAW
jgi:hypothetical protein